MIEYVDHLHEHFVDPVVIRDGRYLLPTTPGYSARDAARSRLADTRFPTGDAWRVRRFGQVIRVRPEAIDEYERLHADPWPGVLAAIERGEHPELLDLSPRGAAVRLLTSTSATTSRRTWRDGRRPDRPAVVDADRRDAGPLSGTRAGLVVADLPEIFHTD